MNCSQPSLLLFIHLGRPRSLFTFHFHCFVLPSPPLSHVPPLKIIPPSFTVPSSLYTLSSLPPPSYYLLVTCSSPPPPPSVLPSIFHLFSTLSFLSSHFEQNRFSIMFWVPGSFYISQPDPNTAGVTPHAPETLTHTHTYISTYTHLIHFRLHLQPNGVEERQENVFSESKQCRSALLSEKIWLIKRKYEKLELYTSKKQKS